MFWIIIGSSYFFSFPFVLLCAIFPGYEPSLWVEQMTLTNVSSRYMSNSRTAGILLFSMSTRHSARGILSCLFCLNHFYLLRYFLVSLDENVPGRDISDTLRFLQFRVSSSVNLTQRSVIFPHLRAHHSSVKRKCHQRHTGSVLILYIQCLPLFYLSAPNSFAQMNVL